MAEPLRSLIIALLLGGLAASPAMAAPPGKSWTVVDTLYLPDPQGVSGPRFEVDSSGKPVLFGVVRGPGYGDVIRMDWSDTSWTTTWYLGQSSIYLWPALSSGPDPLLVFGGNTNPDNSRQLILADAPAVGPGPPDTVATLYYQSVFYAACANDVRRWAAVSDIIPSTGEGKLRLFTRSVPGPWAEIPATGTAFNGVTIAALDDTTALVVYAGDGEGLRWGLIEGTDWQPGAPFSSLEILDGHPRLRPRPSGGYWLASATDRPEIYVHTYIDGVWSDIIPIQCAYRNVSHARNYVTKGLDVSRDAAEYPVLAYLAFDTKSGLQSICAAVPGENGWTIGDDLIGTEDGDFPTVTRDYDGDAWVGFWRDFENGICWLHTFTSAVTSTPTVTSAEVGTLVSWQLSESAPGSWWAVLRGNAPDAFELVARLKAGADANMDWVDSSAAPGTFQYEIRRESVDKRYEWVSQPSDGPVSAVPKEPSLSMIGFIPNPGVGRLSVGFSLANTDPASVDIFSVAGKRVKSIDVSSLGPGRHVIHLENGAVPPGIYWIRVTQNDRWMTKKAVVAGN